MTSLLNYTRNIGNIQLNNANRNKVEDNDKQPMTGEDNETENENTTDQDRLTDENVDAGIKYKLEDERETIIERILQLQSVFVDLSVKNQDILENNNNLKDEINILNTYINNMMRNAHAIILS